MQRVTEKTLPQARALLETAPHLAMFPLSNIDRFGLDGDADYAPIMWTDGQGVLTVTRVGMVMPFFPNGDIGAAAGLLGGRKIIGVLGQTQAARALISQAGLSSLPTTLDRDEPQFKLRIDDMILPKGKGHLIPLQDAPRKVMEEWRVAYDIEALGSREADARDRVGREIDRYIANDSHRVLIVDSRPVCTTGFNACLPDIVQIGGVYTPPELRRQGHARRAVALHLAEAQDAGVAFATLFAANAAAARAYVAIGFQQVGDWTLTLYDGPVVANV